MRIASLYRYPVKGLSPEPLAQAELAPGAYFPGDRLFAVENGPSGFDPAAPVHQPKIKYLMLMRNEALARLRTRYEDAARTLVIEENGQVAVRADVTAPEGREAVAAFFRRLLPRELRGEPRLLAAPEGYRFTDSRTGYVSLINLGSVRAVEELVDAPVDPLRFRGNVYVDGLAPWAEFDLVGREVETASGARLKVTRRTERCAATNVDPDTGLRDLAIPRALDRHLGHSDLGVYAEVIRGGTLAAGDVLALAA